MNEEFEGLAAACDAFLFVWAAILFGMILIKLVGLLDISWLVIVGWWCLPAMSLVLLLTYIAITEIGK